MAADGSSHEDGGLALPERFERLKARALAGPDTPVGWRCLAACETARDHPAEPLIVRRALALARTLEVFPVALAPDESIVGTHLFGERAGVDAALDFPEFSPHVFDAPAERLRAALEHTDLTTEQRAAILAFEGRSHVFVGAPFAPTPPPEVRAAVESDVLFGWGSCVNHSVRDYAKVLREGFEAIAREAEQALAAWRMENPDDLERANFPRAAVAIARAAAGLGARHARVAREMAARETDPERRRELEAVAETCERVPAQPARSLREAVQSLWFAHTITCCEDHINANSIGRLDQILYPYYAADRAAGRITEEGAVELLMLLALKLFRDYDVQQVVLGGQTPDGEDAANDLTYLCLEATRRLGLVRCMSVRVHERTPRRLYEAATELLRRGGGIPFFFNDEAIVPALVDKGIPLEEARDYAVIGCVEVTIPGRACPHAVSHNINLAKCFELALHDGVDPRSGARVGPATGALESFTSTQDVFAAYQAQVEHFARCGVFLSNAGQLQQAHSHPLPYRSLLTADCLQRGRDITAGGARHNFHSCSAIGVPNIADSLAAMEDLVYGSGRIAPARLAELLRTDFEDAEAERLLLLHGAAKYGNDDPAADEWAARICEHYCRAMAAHRTLYGGSFHVHLFSFLWHVDPFGKTTGALPDGRRAGEPLAYSLSPAQGRDRRGVTAVIRSLSRVPHRLAAGSSSAIVELSPAFFEQGGSDRFVALLEAAIAMGVGQLQFNVVTADRLRLAQEDPERYGNIVVRVSGFSQRFSALGRDLQDHIIARMKHER